jgi:WD40 repeat protein
LRPGQPISALAFSPDGKTLAVGNWGPGIRLYEVATGKERRRFVGHRLSVHSVALSGDGRPPG